MTQSNIDLIQNKIEGEKSSDLGKIKNLELKYFELESRIYDLQNIQRKHQGFCKKSIQTIENTNSFLEILETDGVIIIHNLYEKSSDDRGLVENQYFIYKGNSYFIQQLQ